MKKILILLFVALALYFGWQAIQTKPNEGIPEAIVTDSTTPLEQKENTVDPKSSSTKTVLNEQVSVKFKGFGPGKVHMGTFAKISSTLQFTSDDKMAGSVIVDVNSMSTDNEKLTGHLKSADFFDAVKYSTITFSPNMLVGLDAQGAQLEGDLTVKGITKKITIPVSINTTAYTSTFNINMKEFGINQKHANETVEVTVVVPLKAN